MEPSPAIDQLYISLWAQGNSLPGAVDKILRGSPVRLGICRLAGRCEAIPEP